MSWIILWRVFVEFVVGEGVFVGYGEVMVVGWYVENNFVRGDVGGFLVCDGIFGGFLVVVSVVGLVEGGVGFFGC